MNFYIADSLCEVNIEDYNVALSDDIIEYIYSHRKHSFIDLSKLYSIDPYDDAVIPCSEVGIIINICEYLIKSNYLVDYMEKETAKVQITELLGLAEEAVSKSCGMVSLGD